VPALRRSRRFRPPFVTPAPRCRSRLRRLRLSFAISPLCPPALGSGSALAVHFGPSASRFTPVPHPGFPPGRGLSSLGTVFSVGPLPLLRFRSHCSPAIRPLVPPPGPWCPPESPLPMPVAVCRAPLSPPLWVAPLRFLVAVAPHLGRRFVSGTPRSLALSSRTAPRACSARPGFSRPAPSPPSRGVLVLPPSLAPAPGPRRACPPYHVGCAAPSCDAPRRGSVSRRPFVSPFRVWHSPRALAAFRQRRPRPLAPAPRPRPGPRFRFPPPALPPRVAPVPPVRLDARRLSCDSVHALSAPS